jgi:hypothetical protein
MPVQVRYRYCGMVDFEGLSNAERRWLHSRLLLLRDRDSWAMGTFAEHVVAEALPGAEHSSSSIAEWDLTWREIKIEVKCSTQRQTGVSDADKPSAETWRVPTHFAWDRAANAWHPGEKRRWADIYVLARHEGFDHTVGWSFYVVPCSWLNGRESGTATGATLRAAGWGPHTADDLSSVVTELNAEAIIGSKRGTGIGPG